MMDGRSKPCNGTALYLKKTLTLESPADANRLNRTDRKGSNRHMKIKLLLSLLAAASLAFSSAAFAAGAKTYQITGTVVEMTGSKITVQKGTEKWEIDLDPTTKATGDVKVGATVTITYVMSAMKVEGSLGAAGETTPAAPSSAPTP